jgi:hypothetical protein
MRGDRWAYLVISHRYRAMFGLGWQRTETTICDGGRVMCRNWRYVQRARTGYRAPRAA